MMREPAALRCSNGVNCVAYPTLGEPAKLSRSNPGPRCFACEERRVAAELEAVATKAKDGQPRMAKGSRKANRSRHSKMPKERICMKPSCKRPATERDGAAVVCREHAELSRAAAVRERRRAWVLTCERAVRSAIASGNKRLEHRWARLLLAAEVSLNQAETELRIAEIRAQSTPPTQQAKRIPKTG
jgi:hypothetical protein